MSGCAQLENPFKVGDRVRIVGEQTIHFGNYSGQKIGYEFVIKEIEPGSDYCREHQGEVNGVHFKLLELVKKPKIKVNDVVQIITTKNIDMFGQLGTVCEIDDSSIPIAVVLVNSQWVARFWCTEDEVKVIKPLFRDEALATEGGILCYSGTYVDIAENDNTVDIRNDVLFNRDNDTNVSNGTIVPNNKFMNIKNKIKMLMTGEPEKTLIKHGILTIDKELTLEGNALFTEFIHDKFKQEFLDGLYEVLKDEKVTD